jgi:adenine-specific DNA-methyltransferase
MLQSRRSNGGEHGVVMTKRLVVEAMLDLSGYIGTNDLSKIRFTDPAGGDGVYIFSALDRLHDSAISHGFNFSEAVDNLRVVEIDARRAERLETELGRRLVQFGVDGSVASSLVIHDDFLKCNLRTSDIFAGNPPYIRYDNLASKQREYYRKWFKLFRDRSDLYIAFFEKAFRFLSSRGKVCYITPDRWLKNQYGRSLRRFIAAHYSVPAIFNLDGTNPFEEEVYGYPMISLISTEMTDITRYWSIRDLGQLKTAVGSYIENEGTGEKGISIATSIKTLSGNRWIFEPANSIYNSIDLIPIENQGFTIGIGVATGLDSVFVRRNFNEHVEEQLLLPMILSKDIIDGRIQWSGHYVLNPFDPNGGLIDLGKYPKAKRYLEENASLLKKRHVAKTHRKQWFRTIDRIYPELISKPKLLLPDIKKGRFVALDRGEYYPHHNIYYVIGNSVDDLKVLGAIMMSRLFIQQLTAQSVMMHGGFVRHQSQNLRVVRIPRVKQLTTSVRKSLVDAFDGRKAEMVDEILEAHLGLAPGKIAVQHH